VIPLDGERDILFDAPAILVAFTEAFAGVQIAPAGGSAEPEDGLHEIRFRRCAILELQRSDLEFTARIALFGDGV